MTLAEIATLRLFNQQIESSKFKSAKDLVSYMGAMQAQDYAMAKWAVGLRIQNSTDKKIEKAIHDGDIIRIHTMRPTWHFVSTDDVRWMIELTAPQIKAIAKSRYKQLGLSEKILSKSNSIIEKSLRDGNHLTREELMEIIKKAKIKIDTEIATHLILAAELEGIICSCNIKNNKQTYALLDERVPTKKSIIKDEALALLAKKYFSSHAPATLKDFIWWSGLSVKDGTHALEMISKDFISEKMGAEIDWLTNNFDDNLSKKSSVHLLPAFDEFIISYKDRGASLHADHHKKSISNNGIFWPMIVVDGQVTGSWKRTIKKDKLIIEASFFKPHNKKLIAEIKNRAEEVGEFLDKQMEIFFK